MPAKRRSSTQAATGSPKKRASQPRSRPATRPTGAGGKKRRKTTKRPAQTPGARLRSVRQGLALSQAAMGRAIGVSTRKISELETTAATPRTETSRRLREIERLSGALHEIMDSDRVAGWLEEPNDAFEGSTPLQLIERGEVDRLWQMVFAVRSGLPM